MPNDTTTRTGLTTPEQILDALDHLPEHEDADDEELALLRDLADLVAVERGWEAD